MLTEQGEGRKMTSIDLNLDSTPIITWLAQARKEGQLVGPALRRSLLARMIWQVSYQRSTGLIENVAYLIGWRTWGEKPRATLAEDIRMLRHALATAGHHLAYSGQPNHKGFYIRGRPLLDPQLERRMIGAMAEIDPVQMEITRQLTPAQRFAQAMSMIDFVTKAGVYRLRLRQPSLSLEEAQRWVRQGKVA
ncbi:MAG: hypothetical protein U0350_16020 [Caldilineaceae bacterium]